MIIERISSNRQHSADPLEAESELSKETVAGVCGSGRKAKSAVLCPRYKGDKIPLSVCFKQKAVRDQMQVLELRKPREKIMTKSYVFEESPTKILNYK